MTIEELAIRAKAGEPEQAAALFERLCNLFRMFAGRTVAKYPERCARSGVTFDDLFQSCYFAMLEAMRAYDPESGYRFTTYLNYHVKNAFRRVLGLRTEAQRKSPLNNCTSLDDEIPGADNVILSDSIPDENAGLDFEEAERRVYNEKLHRDLDRALSLLPEPCERVLRGRYYQGKTMAEIAEESGITPQAARKQGVKAMRLMRSGERLRILKEYRTGIISRYAYSSGLSSFRHSGASSVEWTVEKLSALCPENPTP